MAKRMVEQGEVPLLGIPSSIPRFKQGPLYIYFLACIYWISHGSLLATGLLAAGFGIAAIIAIYLLVISYGKQDSAVLAAGILAFSPMLLLHSRMPYHINPIPLMVVMYLWQLMRWSHGQAKSAIGVGLAFALVFQFELAAFPLILLIPLARRSWKLTSGYRAVALGLALGLIPQILYDLTHRFAQIGGFLVWVGYKLVTALLPFTKNSFVDAGSGAKVRELVTLFLSIFSQNGSSDIWLWGAVILIVIGLSLWRWKTLRPFHLLIVQATVVSLAGLLIHRVPSEAYMPIVAPIIALTVGYSTQLFSKKIVWAVSTVLAISLFFSLRVLISSHFFLLLPGESDWGAKRFGPSIETQEQIVSKLYEISGNRCITLESLERDVTYPTLYNHLEYLIALDPRSGGASCSRIRIDRAPEARRRWIDQGDVVDLGAYWVRRLDEQRIYANAN